jgi:hypothetical protein
MLEYVSPIAGDIESKIEFKVLSLAEITETTERTLRPVRISGPKTEINVVSFSVDSSEQSERAR